MRPLVIPNHPGFPDGASPSGPELLGDLESLFAKSSGTKSLVYQMAPTEGGDLAAGPVLTPGARLGPYEILGLLAEGGMGKVYRAVDTRLNRPVAIKTSAERFSTQFEQEARTMSSLNHPHICTLYDIGPNYMVTELVEGETLNDWLKPAPAIEQSLEVARQILEALRALHRQGVVHRDLKPQNIMVRFDGYVKVLDFGLAKQMPSAPTFETQHPESTRAGPSGQILGTVAYMSPEQIQGLPVDQRSDLFAFGIILYELLNGHYPWPGRSQAETMHAILHAATPPMTMSTRQGEELGPIVRKLLRKTPADRFPVADAVLEALDGCIASRGSTAGTGTNRKSLAAHAALPLVFLSGSRERQAFSWGFGAAFLTLLGVLRILPGLTGSSIPQDQTTASDSPVRG